MKMTLKLLSVYMKNEPVGGQTFSYEWFRTKSRFDTEAKDNSVMADCMPKATGQVKWVTGQK